MTIEAALAAFADELAIRDKGPLSVVVQLTERARLEGLPLDPARLLTAKEGQVEGLGGGNLKRILAHHGINKQLSSEGGRTSRGSIEVMRAYVRLLNELETGTPLDLEAVMRFWIGRVRKYLDTKPLRLTLDPTLSVQAIIAALVAQAQARQAQGGGQTLVGAMIQHLIGAKLDLIGAPGLKHHSASTNDASARGGDFDLGDTTVHVTTAPGEPLMAKARATLDAGRRPMIVTSAARVGAARAMAEDAGIGTRVDVIDYAQFLATNVFEIGGFAAAGRADALRGLVDRYNAIVAEVEADPGLAIAIC